MIQSDLGLEVLCGDFDFDFSFRIQSYCIGGSTSGGVLHQGDKESYCRGARSHTLERSPTIGRQGVLHQAGKESYDRCNSEYNKHPHASSTSCIS